MRKNWKNGTFWAPCEFMYVQVRVAFFQRHSQELLWKETLVFGTIKLISLIYCVFLTVSRAQHIVGYMLNNVCSTIIKVSWLEIKVLFYFA